MPFREAGCGGPPSGKDDVVGVSGGEEGTVGRRANLTFGVDGWESSEESESQSEESDEDDIFLVLCVSVVGVIARCVVCGLGCW